MIALLDADSIIHKAWYVVENMDLTDSEKIEKGLEIIGNMEIGMFNEFEDEMCTIDEFVYFFTTCTNNFRKELAEDYKATRKGKDPLFYVLFSEYLCYKQETSTVLYSDTLEADDLIPLFIKENGLKPTEYCIFNIDKDLDQLEGFHFNYQKIALKDQNEKIMRYKGLKYISKKEAFYNFCVLMLVGDSSDNISGVNRVGIKTAEKRLKDRSIFGMFRVVVKEYLEKESRDKLELNVKLIRLR